MNYSSYPQEETTEIRTRAAWLAAIVLVIFSFLLVRAWYLQVFQANHYRGMAENNRIRLIDIPAPRGFLYDRHGTLLVNNVPSFNLYVALEDIPDLDVLTDRLSPYIGITPDEIRQRIEAKKVMAAFRPVKIKSDLSFKEVALIEGHRLDLPGVRIEAEVKRNYVYRSMAAHLLGHVGEVSAEQLDREVYGSDITLGSMVGQYGVEKTYDAWVRGKQGQKSIEVNAQGHERSIVKVNEPVKGNDLYLTIDHRLQRVAEEAMGKEAGTIIAMDPWSGDILAMVSHPAFDPNLLSGVVTPASWEALSKNPLHPMNNRAIQGQYPPASIFKLVVSAAMLETDVLPSNFRVKCAGGLWFGKRLYRDWKRSGHGEVGLRRAFAESCDVFYYEVGNKLGVDTIADFSRKFGLGRPTGIPLPSEKPGLIPTTAWKEKNRGEPWYPGETLSAAIGQGYITVTPLQAAIMLSTVATRGYQYQPRVLKRMEGPRGSLGETPPVLTGVVKFQDTTLRRLDEALAGVVEDEEGTGRAARSSLVRIGGKTGTAQVVALRHSAKEGEQPRQLRDHAWFVAVAPLDKPEIVVVVLVEHGGHGGSAAAPIAKKVIEEFKRDDRSTTDHQL